MRRTKKSTPAQFSLFPVPVPNRQVPREVSPKLLPLVVRLLRQYAEHRTTAPRSVEEVNHE
jgi:hypothetical protein